MYIIASVEKPTNTAYVNRTVFEVHLLYILRTEVVISTKESADFHGEIRHRTRQQLLSLLIARELFR